VLHGLVILGAFLDIEDTFDYTISESMGKAAKNMGCNTYVVKMDPCHDKKSADCNIQNRLYDENVCQQGGCRGVEVRMGSVLPTVELNG
jgi:hypothetical protein